MGQPASGTAPANCTSAAVGNIVDFRYDFGPGGSNNGNILQIINNRNGDRTQNFSYDKLNRVAYAWSSGSLWGNQFVYDNWGNLNKKQACPAGSPCAGKPLGEWLDQTSNSNNQIVGFSYDAAGNLTNSGSGVMAYDAENRLINAAAVTYRYNPASLRVQKSGGKIYFYGLGGEVLAEGPLGGPITTVFIHFGGRRIARRDVPTNTVAYYFPDHLGSTSVMTNAGGTITEESDYYPFGGERIITDSDPNQYKFTTYERDSETGYDYAISRYYPNPFGRFLTADSIGGAVANPQSLNRYAYVQNDPVNYVDPAGTFPAYFLWLMNQWALWDQWGFRQMVGGGGQGSSGFSFAFGVDPPDGVLVAQGPFGGSGIYYRPSLLDFLPELCSDSSAPFMGGCGQPTIDGIPIYSGLPGLPPITRQGVDRLKKGLQCAAAEANKLSLNNAADNILNWAFGTDGTVAGDVTSFATSLTLGNVYSGPIDTYTAAEQGDGGKAITGLVTSVGRVGSIIGTAFGLKQKEIAVGKTIWDSATFLYPFIKKCRERE